MSLLCVLESGLRRRPSTYMLGSPGRRFAAKLIDRLLLALALVPALLVSLLTDQLAISLGLGVCGAALALALEWRMSALMGQTPGKYVLGLRVITYAGQLPSFWRGVALRTWAVGAGSLALAGVPLIVDALFVFAENHRCLHDRLAGTLVIVAGSVGDPLASLGVIDESLETRR